jgi:hypothetical protein
VAEVFRGLFPFQCLYHPVFFFSYNSMFSYFLFVIIELVQNFSIVVYIVLHDTRDSGYIVQNL